MEFQHPPILEAVVLGLHVQQRNQQVIEYVQLQYCTAPSVGLKKKTHVLLINTSITPTRKGNAFVQYWTGGVASVIDGLTTFFEMHKTVSAIQYTKMLVKSVFGIVQKNRKIIKGGNEDF